jgi:hypothetical protein
MLHFLQGDGRGSFAVPEEMFLPRRITAMTGGEMNQPDGLTHIVIAVNSASGPQLVVFQGPKGAMRSRPEVRTLPGEATELALGRIYGDSTMDLAAALELFLMRGRDGSRETVSVAFGISGMATGNRPANRRAGAPCAGWIGALPGRRCSLTIPSIGVESSRWRPWLRRYEKRG